MHVIVIGAGVIGVTTAYCLRRLGCKVTVLERNSGVAHEASFANGGVIVPGHTGLWAAPGAVFRQDAAMRVWLSADRALWRWLRQFVSQTTSERYAVAKRRLHRLARYSQEEMRILHARHAIDFEQQAGLLKLSRSEEELARHAP